MTTATAALPAPTLSRWQPLRAGLVDMFYYDREEFWFRDGRLLLRGNNGTGKSKVLALMLPFLLDVDLSAHRVEPDADPKKRMEWNLLLGGAHPHGERLGYTWLEFGRIDDDGTLRFRTIGAGLKAVRGKGMTPPWFFITDQRIGEEISLIDQAGIALSKDRLADALGERGTRFDRAREYRRAVDEALFGLGEQRYGALVDLLIQLRQPQLSKRPSEKALSAALTEALPPLDQAILADVAEAFRSLQEDREDLADLKESRDATATFLRDYRRYARVASRRRAAEPRKAQSQFERITRELTEAEAAHAEAEQRTTTARAEIDRLDTDHTALRERDRALRDSEVMDSARELETADVHLRERTTEVQRAARELDSAAHSVESWRGRHTAATAALDVARARLAESVDLCRGHADDAGIGAAHRATVDGLAEAGDHASGGTPGPEQLENLQRSVHQLVDSHARAIQGVAALADTARAAQGALAHARLTHADIDSHAADLADQAATAQAAVGDESDALVAALGRHLDGTHELRVADLAELLAEVRAWADTVTGPNPALARISAATATASEHLARLRAGIESQAVTLRERRAGLADEQSRLEAGEDNAPPPPHTRDATARTERPGAPLWQVTDFAAGLGADDRAGIEAALEASGILDAWLTPDGDLLDAGTGDVLLAADPQGSSSASLSGVLVPAIDQANAQSATLSDAIVVAALSAIGVGAESDSHTWVDAHGRFRIGVLAGSWRKPAAEYVGRGAREAARRDRLATLRDELAAVDEQLAELSAHEAAVVERIGNLRAEVAGAPADDALRQAHSKLAALESEVRRVRERRAESAARVEAAEASHRAAAERLAADAADAQLPTDRDELGRLRESLQEYRIAVAALWPAAARVHASCADVARHASDLEHAEQTHAERTLLLAETRAREVAARERHRTLRETVGAEVAELHRRLAEVAEIINANRQARDTANAEHEGALEARGRAEGRRIQLAEQLEEARATRAAATESLRRFAATGLLAVALPELEVPDTAAGWHPDPAVRLARRVDQDLADVDAGDDASDHAHRRVAEQHKTLADVLGRQGNSTAAQLLDDGIVIEVTFRGRPLTVDALADALEAEVADRERLLTEREREILENHLVNEVASTMQQLIADAEAQVARMNAELDGRPTSTGMRLRLHWQPREDGPAGLAAAQQKLRQTADAWSEDDRGAVGAFLQQEIADARVRNSGGTWLEHLTEALDYRSWNRFVIKRHQNGQWRSATGPASGGERVLAASVPLFAAASAHYGSAANPHAPRLVTLDEAFAGVDDNARAKYLGLLAAFDLDVVMTSEREWGCYPEVPGLAIAQLSRTDDVAAVLVTRWEWDGRQRSRAPEPTPPTLVDVEKPDPTTQGGLWE